MAHSVPKRISKDRKRWGQRDLNPRQRVSTAGGATSHGINESSLQLVITTYCQPTHFNHAHNWSPPVCQVSLYPLECDSRDHFLRIFAALFLLLIFFLRHFQRWLPRFFQAREPLFMVFPSLNASSLTVMHPWRARRDSNPRRLA